MSSVRVIGDGRAGGSMARALARAGWVVEVRRRGDPLADAAGGVELLLLATPDAVVAEVATSVRPGPAVVAHLAGSLGLDVLEGHERRGSLHPLVSLPSPELGADRLVGAWFAVAGDPLVEQAVRALAGRAVVVADERRSTYHAAACVAANHLVALLGQVDRLAATAGVPLEPFLDLAAGALANVRAVGPAAALTGPAARGDDATIGRHRAALPADELPAYDALVAECRRLARRRGAEGAQP